MLNGICGVYLTGKEPPADLSYVIGSLLKKTGTFLTSFKVIADFNISVLKYMMCSLNDL